MSKLPSPDELIDALAATVQLDELVARIHANYKKSALALIEVGRDLIAAKTIMPHGAWGGWLDENFGLSQSSAHNFMRVAEQFGDNPEILNGCDFGSRVLYALAAPSTPEVVRDVVIFEARQSEAVDLDRVKEVKADADSEAGVYFGEDVKSLDGSAVLEAGDACEVTGITFASNPQLVYVRAGDATFLVDRDDVEFPRVEGNRVEIVDPTVDDRQYSLFPVDPPQSVEEESDRRAVALGLPKSRVQVLPDVDRREAPGDVDDRLGVAPVDRPWGWYTIRIGGVANIHETVSALVSHGWSVEVLRDQEVGDD